MSLPESIMSVLAQATNAGLVDPDTTRFQGYQFDNLGPDGIHGERIFFNVDLAIEIVKRDPHRPRVDMSVREWWAAQGVESAIAGGLDPVYAMDRNPKPYPPIAATLDGKNVLIDGNHRALAAARTGVSTLAVYVLTEAETASLVVGRTPFVKATP